MKKHMKRYAVLFLICLGLWACTTVPKTPEQPVATVTPTQAAQPTTEPTATNTPTTEPAATTAPTETPKQTEFAYQQ